MDTPATTTAQALADAAAEIEAVGKDHKADPKMGAYAYRSVDDVIAAAHKVLPLHGITIVPSGVTVWENRFVQRGDRIQHHIVGLAHYTILGPGEPVEGAYPLSSSDYSDKAPTQAASTAYKYFLIQLLSIPVRDMLDADQSRDAHLQAGPPPASDRQKNELWDKAQKLGMDVHQAAQYAAPITGREVGGMHPGAYLSSMTADDAVKVITALDADLSAAQQADTKEDDQ